MNIFLLFLGMSAILCILIIIAKQTNEKQAAEHGKAPESQKREFTEAECEAMRQADEVWDMETYFAISEGTYTGPLPEHIVGGHWTDLYPNIYRTKIAGINFSKEAKAYAGQFVNVMLCPDPKNQYDPNAIKVVTVEYAPIGFIPADETASVREWVGNKFPYSCRARVEEHYEYDSDTDKDKTYLNGRICIPKPQK